MPAASPSANAAKALDLMRPLHAKCPRQSWSWWCGVLLSQVEKLLDVENNK
jgi:hypothetical protein